MRASVESETDFVTTAIDLCEAREKEDFKRGLMHRLSDCRLTPKQIEVLNCSWAACKATPSDVHAARMQAQTAPTPLGDEYKTKLERMPLLVQFNDEIKTVPEWGKQLARLRQWAKNLAPHTMTAQGDRWFSIAYSRKSPLTTSFQELRLLPTRPPSSSFAPSDLHRTFDCDHAFSWDSPLTYWRDIDWPEVRADRISVVPCVYPCTLR